MEYLPRALARGMRVAHEVGLQPKKKIWKKVNAYNKLIEIFEQKIKDKIGEVWGE